PQVGGPFPSRRNAIADAHAARWHGGCSPRRARACRVRQDRGSPPHRPRGRAPSLAGAATQRARAAHEAHRFAAPAARTAHVVAPRAPVAPQRGGEDDLEPHPGPRPRRAVGPAHDLREQPPRAGELREGVRARAAQDAAPDAGRSAARRGRAPRRGALPGELSTGDAPASRAPAARARGGRLVVPDADDRRRPAGAAPARAAAVLDEPVRGRARLLPARAGGPLPDLPRALLRRRLPAARVRGLRRARPAADLRRLLPGDGEGPPRAARARRPGAVFGTAALRGERAARRALPPAAERCVAAGF